MDFNIFLDVVLKYGYFILFFGAFFEALPLIGILIPGQTIIIASGFLIKTSFKAKYVIAFALAGVVLGDLASYFLGKFAGKKLLKIFGKKKWFNKGYRKTRSLLNSHLGKTILIGKLYSVTRAFLPLVAGLTKIDLIEFIFYNTLGAIVWVISLISFGYVFGTAVQEALLIFGKFVLIMMIVFILITIIYLSLSLKKKIFNRRDSVLFLINLFSLVIFTKLGFFIIKGKKLIMDKAIIDLRQNTHAVNIISSFSFLEKNTIHLFFLVFSIIILLVLLGILLKKKNFYHFYLIVISSIASLIATYLLQYYFKRKGHGILEFGFPHLASAIILITLTVTLLLMNQIRLRCSVKHSINFLIIILLLYYTSIEIFIRNEYLTNIIGGYSLGLFFLTFSGLTLRFLIRIDFVKKAKYKFENLIKKIF